MGTKTTHWCDNCNGTVPLPDSLLKNDVQLNVGGRYVHVFFTIPEHELWCLPCVMSKVRSGVAEEEE